MKHIFHNTLGLLLINFGMLIGPSSIHAAVTDELVFFHTDALGSAVTAVNENGDLCWSENYTPYGDKTINDDLFPVTGSGCGLLGEERGYTGHTEDFSTDLVYMQQRYYDPSLGRFLSIDPIEASAGDTRTLNRYSYVANNPYKFIDPTGMYWSDYSAEDIDQMNIDWDIESGTKEVIGDDYGSGGGSRLGDYSPNRPGFHDYWVPMNEICSTGRHCTYEEMQDFFPRFLVPGQDPANPVQDQDINMVVDPSTLTIKSFHL